MSQPDSDLQDAVAFIATYPPRQCGIGTFTYDLARAVHRSMDARLRTVIIAMDDPSDDLHYPPEVQYRLSQHETADYVRAAEFLNYNKVRAVSLQHEFGIFGGHDGSYILDLLRELRCPIISTFHTILETPSEGQRKVMDELVVLSSQLVVMSERAVEFLQRVYNAPPQKIRLIHHGVPEIPLVEPAQYKGQFDMEGRELLLTFGLLSPGKGIEFALRALPPVVEEFPNLCYVVLGATHPNVLREAGESYRLSLQRQARDLGLQRNVLFNSRFVSLEELCEFLKAADVYMTPYLNREQITSGTLAYALGAGKPIVSTPYWYAEELLSDSRGVLVGFRDPESISEGLLGLLRSPTRVLDLRTNAYEFSRRMTWAEVGRQYLETFRQAISTARVRASMPDVNLRYTLPITGLPRPKLDHLARLTDDTGLLQHAKFTVPDRVHGYCTDDNARGLVVSTKFYDLFRSAEAERLMRIYLSFVGYAQRPDGLFHNFMNYERHFLDEAGSDDCYGRALWGLGYTMHHAPTGYLSLAKELFERALGNLHSLNLRGRAYAMLGLYYYLQRYPEADDIVEKIDRLAAGAREPVRGRRPVGLAVVRGRGGLRQRRHPAVALHRLRGHRQHPLPGDSPAEPGLRHRHVRQGRPLLPGGQRRLEPQGRGARRLRPATHRRLRAGGGVQGGLPPDRGPQVPAPHAHGVRLVPGRQRQGPVALRLQERRLRGRARRGRREPEPGRREHALLPALPADPDRAVLRTGPHGARHRHPVGPRPGLPPPNR